MHAFVEEPNTSHCDCVVQSLSWMGRTPDGQPENGAWRLNEANYYHQGWLASGNTRGVIGITFTACQSKNVVDQPPRTNFYLRGHRSEVRCCSAFQKLNTSTSDAIYSDNDCDVSTFELFQLRTNCTINNLCTPHLCLTNLVGL